MTKDLWGPLVLFGCAVLICTAALLIDNRCEPLFAAMVGGCR